jgi:hypothetical protein
VARKTYDLAVKIGTYQTKDGQTKNRYQNIGAAMENDDGGMFLMLAKWFNPAGVQDGKSTESILVSMFPPREKGAAGNDTPF